MRKIITVSYDSQPKDVADGFISQLQSLGIKCGELPNIEHRPEIEYYIDYEKRPSVGVAILINRNGQVLLHKRKGTVGSGLHGFPGGHLEQYESFEEAANRELVEECGPDLKVRNLKFLSAASTPFPQEFKHYVVIYMYADYASGEAVVTEPEKCEFWRWYDWNNLPSPLMPGIIQLKDQGLVI